MGRVSEVVGRIVAIDTRRSTRLVAVDGPGGAGKTVLAAEVAGALRAIGRRAETVHFDDFFLPSAQRSVTGGPAKPIGGDFDWRRLRDEVLVPLREEQPARYSRYDWHLDALVDVREVLPGATVLVEGIYTSRRELAPLYDLRIWVECPRHLRLSRGLERDGEASRARWELDWMPEENRYVAEHRPRERADLVVGGAPD